MKKTLLLLATTSIAGSALAVDTLTAVSWGGAYQFSQQKSYAEPYTAETGVSFVWDESSADATAKLRAQNEAGNLTWDVVDVDAGDSFRLCDEGLARPMDFDAELAAGDDGSSATDDFGTMIVNDCFIPQIVYSTTWGYRNDIAEWNGKEPDDICDVFDMENFPGKRSIESRPVNNMEWGLYCDGVAKEDIYDVLATPEGQDRALAKWGTIKDQIVFWNAGADTPQLLADGEIAMGSTYNGRLFNAIAVEKQPINMLWDAQVFGLDGWIIPTGLPEDRLAVVMDFIKKKTDTKSLAEQAKYISYGPARASSAPLVGQHYELGIDMAPHMPTDPANAANTIVFDYEFWGDYRDDIDAKWNAWLAQ